MRSCLFLAVFTLTSTIYASDLKTLDLAQEKLTKEYAELTQKFPSPEDVLSHTDNYSDEDLKEKLSSLKLFFKHYDSFNNQKIRYFTDLTHTQIQRAVAKILPDIKKRDRKKIKVSLKKVEELYQDTFIKEALFGGPNDFLRVVAFRNFYMEVAVLINELVQAEGNTPSHKAGKSILPYTDSMSEFLPVAPDFLKLMYQLYFRTNAGGQGEAPIIETLKNSQKKIAKIHGTTFHWDGLENLEANPYDGETIHLFFMNHANSYYDTTAQVNFPAEGVSSIGNVNVIFPPFMAKRLKKSNNMVTVGDGHEIEHIEKTIKEKRLNRFMVATEGLTPVGFYEMRPMLTNVAPILKAIKDKGLKIKLYPMTFPDHLTLMNEWRSPMEMKSNRAHGVLHSVINHEQIFDLTSRTGDDDSICQFIRYVWFKDLKNSPEVLLGMPKPSEINHRMKIQLWSDLSTFNLVEE
ncbi:MAG: hypothetical protein ACOYL6_00845 [Bacteriovoracaceae bacterium]